MTYLLSNVEKGREVKVHKVTDVDAAFHIVTLERGGRDLLYLL